MLRQSRSIRAGSSPDSRATSSNVYAWSRRGNSSSTYPNASLPSSPAFLISSSV
jgi:hypothetical protein